MSKLKDSKKVNYILGLKDKHNSAFIRSEIRRTFGVKKTRGNQIFHTLFSEKVEEKLALNEKEIPTKKTAAFIKSGDNAVAEVCGSPDIKTLDELLKVTGVNLEEWKVEKYVVNKWSIARKAEVKSLEFSKGTIDGTIEDDGSMSVTPLFQVKAWLVRKKEVSDRDFILNEFKKHLNEIGDKKEFPEAPKRKGLLYEIAIPDIHIGKLVWGEEIGSTSFDSNQAVALFKKAVVALVESIDITKVEKILLPIGNDFYNVDNAAGTTTAGTKVDEDSRWKNSFGKGAKLITDVIEYLSKFAPVDVVIVQGNHDNERSFYLGEYLSAWFKNHKDVTIDNSAPQRKYYKWKKVLIGFTHGNEEKHSELPLIMATERSKDWSECTCRNWHLGHFHRERLEDIKGVMVHVLPSLTQTDGWHFSKGFIGTKRAAEGLLFDDSNLIATHYFRPDAL
jgi:predicted phosphodiesterase